MTDTLLVAPVSRMLRLRSMIGDHIIMGMVCVPVAMVLFPVVAKEAFYFMLVPYLNKDFLQGRSPAKRLLGLQLQDATGSPTNELRAFLRNVTAMMWPVEVLLIVLGSRKRLGDYIAGTQVVRGITSNRMNSWQQDLVAYRVTPYTLYTLLATLLYLLLLHGFFTWIGL
jgi:uncharacterized RDD family membrane protein YckC